MTEWPTPGPINAAIGESRVPDASLGPCCGCDTLEGVRNVLMLHAKAPVLGRGWGCVTCDLPLDGALAVVCDACLEAVHRGASLRFACRGYPAVDGRVPIEQLTGTHDHVRSRHAPEDALP